MQDDRQHLPNGFGVIPTALRLNANPNYNGAGVTIAFLDSGFYPHPDLVEPINRILVFHDVTGEAESIDSSVMSEASRWHGTQTSVVAAGNGHLSDGVYKGLASGSELVLVKASDRRGGVTEENLARGIEWVIANRKRYHIRVLNISLGGDHDIPSSQSVIDQAAEEAVRQGIVVVAAAGNSGHEGRHSIPPANAPSVITVGGYNDCNDLDEDTIELYPSNFGTTADGSVKPEIIAPAMWVAAPILPDTPLYLKAETLSRLAAAPDYELPSLISNSPLDPELKERTTGAVPSEIMSYIEDLLRQQKVVAEHYQHVDGTSFAAPIVSSIVAQMLQANPSLTPGAVKNILLSTADRIASAPAIRQGYGVVDAHQAVELAATEKHALNYLHSTPPRIINGRLLFVFHHDTAERVSLAGDFNNWDVNQLPLQKDGEGLWRIELPAPEVGTYQYKFVINGEGWLEDPGNGFKANDNFGGLNSVIVIK